MCWMELMPTRMATLAQVIVWTDITLIAWAYYWALATAVADYIPVNFGSTRWPSWLYALAHDNPIKLYALAIRLYFGIFCRCMIGRVGGRA